MRPVTAGTIIQAAFGTVAEPGTITSTSVDWAAHYHPDISYYAACGAISAGGTVVAAIQGSDAVSSNFTSLGSVTFNDAAGGTATKSVDIDATAAKYRYYRSLITVTGGTVTGGVSAGFVGQPYTAT